MPTVSPYDQLLGGLLLSSQNKITAAWNNGGYDYYPGVTADYLRQFTVNLPPQFTSPSSFNVPANSAAGTVVGDLQAVDPLGYQLTYALAAPSPFAINAQTGQITVQNAAALQSGRSLPSQFQVAVEASNNGVPPLTTGDTITINVLPAPTVEGATLETGDASLQVTFSEPVVGADQASNCVLQSAGPDGLLGTADDVVTPISSIAYSGTTATLSFAALPEGVYRLTVKDTVTDAAGNQLDGVGAGVPGSNYVHDFVVTTNPVVSLTSPNGFTFGTQSGGDGAGQLVSGSDNAFDGLNRLQVGGVDYAPSLPVYTPPVAQVQTLPSQFSTSSTTPVAVSGLSETFSTSGGPVRLAAQLTVWTYQGAHVQVAAELVVDGKLVGLPQYAGWADAASGQQNLIFDLTDYLTTLTAGNHTVGVDVWSTTGQTVYLFSTSEGTENQVSAVGVGTIPGVGLAETAHEQDLTANFQTSSTTPTASGLSETITTSGGPVQLAADLTVYVPNTSSGAEAQLVVDGKLVGAPQIAGTSTAAVSQQYLTFDLAAYLPTLSAGTHTVSVDVWSTAGQPVELENIWQNHLSAVEINPIPGVGPSEVAHEQDLATTFVTSSTAAVPGLSETFTTSGGPVQLSAELTAQGAFTEDAVVAQLLVDGSPVGSSQTSGARSTNTDPQYATLDLDAYLPTLAAGVHTVSVEIGTLNGNSVPLPSTVLNHLSAIEYVSSPVPTLDDGALTVVTPTETLSGLQVQREVTVTNQGGQAFARTVEVFQNATNAAVTTTVHLVGNLGSDAATQVFATSSGDATPSVNDQWIGTGGGNTPALIHYIHGPLGLEPTSVDIVGDNIEWTYNITVAAGQTLRLAELTIESNTEAGAIAAAGGLVSNTGFTGQAGDFLSAADLASLANFQFYGPVSPAQSTVSVASASISTGGSSTVTFTARDANGNQLPTGGLTVVFGLAAGSPGGTFSAVKDNGNGTYTATFTGTSAGVDAITATVAGQAVVSPAPTVSVAPTVAFDAIPTAADAATLVINGSGFSLTPANDVVTFGDGAGGVVTAATSTHLTVTNPGGFIAGPLNASVTVNGVSSGPAFEVGVVTASLSPGNANLPASSTTLTIHGFGFDPNVANDVVTFGGGAYGTVTAATPTQLTVSNLTGLTAGNLPTFIIVNGQGGGPASIATVSPVVTSSTAALADDGSTLTIHGFGFDANPANDAVTFSGDATGDVTAATSTQLTVTGLSGLTVGDLTASVESDGVGSGGAMQVANVTPGAVSLSRSTVTMTPAALTAGSTATVTLTARDATGAQELSGSLPVAFVLGGGSGGGAFSAVTDHGNGTYTAVFTATTAGSNTIMATVNGQSLTSTAPGFTVPAGPTGTLATDQPIFTWLPVAGATRYEVWVADQASALTPVLYLTNVAGTSLQLAPSQALTPGQGYNWYLGAVVNGSVVWGSLQSFQIAPLASTTLSGPVGVVPAGSGYDRPTFTWTAVTGAASYNVYLLDNTSKQFLFNTNVGSATSYTPGAALTPGHSFTWYVGVDSTNGSIFWNGPQTFSLAALPAPVQQGPLGTIAAGSGYDRPTFTWTAVPGAGSYTVYLLDTTANKVLVNANVGSAPSYTPSAAPAPGHSYTWYVAADSTNGTALSWSGPQSFALAALPQPALMGPSGTVTPGGGATTTVTFSWALFGAAANYYLYVLDATTNQAAVNTPSLSGTSSTAALKSGDSFTWYLGAESSSGAIAWSWQTFSLATAAVAAPTQRGPAGPSRPAPASIRPRLAGPASAERTTITSTCWTAPRTRRLSTTPPSTARPRQVRR